MCVKENSRKEESWSDLAFEKLINGNGKKDYSQKDYSQLADSCNKNGILPIPNFDRLKIESEKMKKSKRMNLSVKLEEVLNKWNNLFQLCYEVKYHPSGKEKGLMRNICKENLEGSILSAMSVCFFDHLTQDFFLSRNIIPCLLLFAKKFDYWKSRGLTLEKYMDFQSEYWWFINKSGLSLSNLPKDLGILFKAESNGNSKIHLWVLKNGKIKKVNWNLGKEVIDGRKEFKG